jgi:hypothetical protein
MSEKKLKHIIDQLKKGDQKTLEKIYLENREGFISTKEKTQDEK